MKTCYKCQKSKSFQEFAKDTRSKDGLQTKCKECDRSYREANASKIAEYKSDWNKNPINNTKVKRAAYKKANPHKCNSSKAKRRAAKLNRTPKWLKPLDFTHIEMFYKAASDLTKELGIEFQVDHIIPLQGKLISGLHVPSNLQVLSRAENELKLNKWVPND